MEGIIIRPAREKDLKFILSILNEEILHGIAIYDYEIKSIDFINSWFEEKTSSEFPVLVAELKGEILGYATYGLFRPREGYRFSVEHSVYLTKDAQGKGIGRLLMQVLIPIAIENGFHRMLAVVDASNQGSCHFHTKMGFKEVGKMTEVGYKFNRWLDVVILQLNLDKFHRN
jgi:phosphinothricin acetyltransferase